MSSAANSAVLPIGPDGTDTVYLLDAATGFEANLLQKWIEKHNRNASAIRINPARRRRVRVDDDLSLIMSEQPNTYLVPLRVVWMAPEKRGRRSVTWAEALRPGDPRDPYWLRARLIRLLVPKRVKFIAGTGARVDDLKTDYENSAEADGLERFVTRRAWRSLDRVERVLRGNRYKIPRFVPESILSRREFKATLDEHATKIERDPDWVHAKASKYLHEIAATHSPYVIDLVANAIHALYKQGYGSIRYSDDEVTRIASLGADSPVVFLPSHRSNMDRLSFQFMLWENDLPPNHTAGGINLNFFPIGPLLRRSGVFFIRRSFKDNELYKIVLRSYIDYLVEKRLPLEWYMEGGRSRSGRLNPPRFGMLHYVVDAFERGKSDEIHLVPVSIAYDQIQDVADYAREAQGRGKEKESIGWLVKAIRSMRQRYGDIHIRFGEPVSVSSAARSSDEDSLSLQKLAFEVMYRIGRATPFTPVSIVSIALLAARGQALTVEELAASCLQIRDFIAKRQLPITESVSLTEPDQVLHVLEQLAEHGNVSSHEAVGRKVYWLDDNQMIRTSYYRNTVVHFFVNRAIAEMGLASALENGSRDPEEIFEEALRIRDLLKFEFFFPEKGEFVKEISAEIGYDVPDWRGALDARGPLGVLAEMGDPVAHWSVLPFLDAYQVVGDELENWQGTFEEKAFLKACMARAKMYRIENRLFTGESASQVLFKSALSLAENRGLLADDTQDERSAFAEEVRAARNLSALGVAAD